MFLGICRHAPGDISCSSHPANVERRNYEYEKDKKEKDLRAKIEREFSPDPSDYRIIDAHRVENHLVLKVRYPSCKRCSYEGNKVLVFLNCPESVVLRWNEIDPHFRPKGRAGNLHSAPGPDARFPASKEGWEDAIAYAESKTVLGRAAIQYKKEIK